MTLLEKPLPELHTTIELILPLFQLVPLAGGSQLGLVGPSRRVHVSHHSTSGGQNFFDRVGLGFG